MSDIAAEDLGLAALSLKKICMAYKQIFSVISPYYHKRDFEINKKCFFLSLINEMTLRQEIKINLISLFEKDLTIKAFREELLGEEYETTYIDINRLVDDLVSAIASFQGNSKHALYLAILKKLHSNKENIAPEFEDAIKSDNYDIEQLILRFSQEEFQQNKISLVSPDSSSDTIDNNALKDVKVTLKNAKEILSIALQQGKTYRECAETFGGSTRMVSYYAKKYKLNNLKKRSEISIESLRDALDQGKTYRECAEIFMCSIDKIAYNARKYNLNKSSNKLARNHLTKEKLEYYLMKMTPAQFALKYGYDKQYIYSRMRALGIKCCIRQSSDENDIQVLKAIKEKPCIQFDDLINKKILSRGALSKSIQRMRDKGLVGFGYKTKLDLFNEKILDRPSMEIEQKLFNLVRDEPGISSEILSDRLKLSEDGILKLVNNLITHDIIQFGYVALDACTFNAKGVDLCGNGNYDEGIAYYERALKINKSFADCYYNKGRALSALFQYEKAVESYDAAIQIDSSFWDALYFKGTALMKLGDYDNALICFNSVIDANPKHVFSLHNKGVSLYMLGRYSESLKFYDMALEEGSRNSKLWYNRGLACKKLFLYEDAIESYDKALEIDPTDIKALNNKGTILKKIGKYNEALILFNRAFELHPEDKNILNNKGNILSLLNNYEASLTCYDKAIELDSSNPIILYNKAITLFHLKKIEEAILYYELVLNIDPNFILAWINKGTSYEHLGQHEEAIECFERAIKLDHSMPIVWYYKGNVLIHLDRYKEADDCYNKAIDLNPKLYKVWNKKGQALTALGRYTDAREAYSEAEDLISLCSMTHV